MTTEASDVIPLDYAAPSRVIDPWQGWPLASGALYAVVTGVWVFIWIPYGIGYELGSRSIAFRVAMAIWAPAQAFVAIPLLRRARKYRRPMWLESLCMAVSICCLLVVISWLTTDLR